MADNGVGFNPAYQARLFQPFSRLHSGAAFEGLGLGLAITRKIIERHGGRIEASSEPDGGCRVSVRLPLA
ncbi:MAG: ATP-binding protein [Betaproteobacteria bacterium]|nr:ATP-binding protein [Betaproteobacteria bacterium]